MDISGHNLTLEQFEHVVFAKEKVSVSRDGLKRVKRSYETLCRLAQSSKPNYGVNTGFGLLKDATIKESDQVQLQINLLRSHACGVGPPFETTVVRGVMLLGVNCFLKGYSGVSPAIVNQIVNFLNCGIHPVIPSQGSVGSSGDLAPSAHYALVLIGEGETEYKGKVMSAARALRLAGLKPVSLGPKSGLALINVTHPMTSVLSVTLLRANVLAKTADIVAALTLEALRANQDAFAARVHRLRPFPGQLAVASNIRKLINGSKLENWDIRREPIQDAYSLRCIPQVHGASRQIISHVGSVVATEYGSVTDNPLVIGKRIISAGHFHGQPLAVAGDYLAIGLAELGNISERRLERLVNPQLSKGLPAFLVANPGLNSGFMIVQYAAAALVSENKSLAHPASVDSIPTSANQEDHVSMGTIAARKASQVAINLTKVLALELLTVCQALDLLAKQHKLASPRTYLSPALGAIYQLVRREVRPLLQDRIMAPDIEKISGLVGSGKVVRTIEKFIPLT